jgi:beta-phosphoglucomutase-like phosphatase (HAD superfamily)
VDPEARSPIGPGQIQAVLFDCDGVLVDTEPLGRTILLEHLRSYPGYSNSINENDLSWIWPLGAPLGPSLARAQALLKQRPDLVPKAILSQESWPLELEFSIRKEMGQQLSVRSYAISGMPDLFARLYNAKTCLIGVCSNGPISKMRESLRQDDFPGLNWSHVFSGHAINCFKPDPGLLHFAAQSLGLDVRNILLIDDSDAGIAAAAAAGMPVCAFSCAFGHQAETSPERLKADCTRPKAHLMAIGAQELSQVLGSLGLLTGRT